MYILEDTAYSIRETQKLLSIIADTDDTIRVVAIDGIYSDEYASAIRDYQLTRGLTASSEIDRETFDLLYTEAEEISKRDAAHKQIRNSDEFPLSYGKQSDNILLLNNNLTALGEYYKDIPTAGSGEIFTSATEDAVKHIQLIFGEIDTGIVNELLFVRIIDELHEREKF